MSRLAAPATVPALIALSLAGCNPKYPSPEVAAPFAALNAEMRVDHRSAMVRLAVHALDPERRCLLLNDIESADTDQLRQFFREVEMFCAQDHAHSLSELDRSGIALVHGLALLTHQQVERAHTILATVVSTLEGAPEHDIRGSHRELMATAYHAEMILGLELIELPLIRENAAKLCRLQRQGSFNVTPSSTPTSIINEATLLALADPSLWAHRGESGLHVSPEGLSALIAVVSKLDPKHPTAFETNAAALYAAAAELSQGAAGQAQLNFQVAAFASPRDYITRSAEKRLLFVLGVADTAFGIEYTDFEPCYAADFFARGLPGIRAAAWSRLALTTAPQEIAQLAAATAYDATGVPQCAVYAQQLRREAINLRTRVSGHRGFDFSALELPAVERAPVATPIPPAPGPLASAIDNYPPTEDIDAPLRLLIAGTKFLHVVGADLDNAGTPGTVLQQNRHEVLGAISALRRRADVNPETTRPFAVLLQQLEAMNERYNTDSRLMALDRAIIEKVSSFRPEGR